MCDWPRNKLVARASLVMIASLGLAGCGETTERIPFAGTVTWQGRPLAKGSILFVPSGEHRGPKIGAPIVNGDYQIDEDRGATPGTYRVEVRADSGEYPHSPTDARPKTITPAPKSAIPPEYNRRSKLTALVSKDQTRFDFDLPLPAN
jgi:hypothetical protein